MNRTPEGDELLDSIRQYVHGRVPPAYEEVTVEIVATTLVTMMSEPRFYNHLRVVIDLQKRILQLEAALSRYQAKMPSVPPAARPRKRPENAVKKTPVKKATKKPPLPYNVRQFRKGAQGK